MICPNCEEAKLEHIEEHEPWHPGYWICPKCDSTYNEEEVDE